MLPVTDAEIAAREKILARVKYSEAGCWLWTGPTNEKGYGLTTVKGKTVRVHRIAYELWKGPIPPGLQIDHLCRTRNCFNPEHLEAVTPRENVLRGESSAALRARKTHCVHGHPFDDTNTARWPDGTRRCLTCRPRGNGKFRRSKAELAELKANARLLREQGYGYRAIARRIGGTRVEVYYWLHPEKTRENSRRARAAKQTRSAPDQDG